MNVYSVSVNGEINVFSGEEEMIDCLFRKGMAYMAFDHWPTETEYFKSRHILSEVTLDLPGAFEIVQTKGNVQ